MILLIPNPQYWIQYPHFSLFYQYRTFRSISACSLMIFISFVHTDSWGQKKLGKKACHLKVKTNCPKTQIFVTDPLQRRWLFWVLRKHSYNNHVEWVPSELFSFFLKVIRMLEQQRANKLLLTSEISTCYCIARSILRKNNVSVCGCRISVDESSPSLIKVLRLGVPKKGFTESLTKAGTFVQPNLSYLTSILNLRRHGRRSLTLSLSYAEPSHVLSLLSIIIRGVWVRVPPVGTWRVFTCPGVTKATAYTAYRKLDFVNNRW